MVSKQFIKYISYAVVIGSIVSVGSINAVAAPPMRASKAAAAPKLNSNFNVQVKDIKSSNGLEAWYIEEHRVPIITLKIAFRNSGAAYDENGSEGLANMLSNMLMEGAGDYGSKQFKKELEQYAIDLSFNVDNDYLFVQIKTLSENFDKAMSLLTLALTEPQFPSGELSRLQKQGLALIDKSEEDPNYIAERNINEIMFADHPYGRPIIGTKKSLKGISVSDLQKAFKQRIVRENMVISMVGDLNSTLVTKTLDTYLAKIPSNAASEKDKAKKNKKNKQEELVKEVTEIKAGQENIKKNIPQAVIIWGGNGVKRSDPDFYTAYILNYMLGGGSFESILMKELREKRGLVYSSYSYLENYEHSSLLRIGTATATKNVNEVINVMKQVNTNLKAQLTEKDLDDAKKYLMGSFPLQLDTNEKLALFLSIMQLDNLGKDFLQKRNSYIEKVTLEDVKRVADKLLSQNKFAMVVVSE